MGLVEYAIEGIKVTSAAVGTLVAASFLVLENACISFFTFLLIAADAIFQYHATHTVHFIFFPCFYNVVIAV